MATITEPGSPTHPPGREPGFWDGVAHRYIPGD